MINQESKKDVMVFGPDENARFTVHLSNCKSIIEYGHLDAMTISVASRRDVVADVYGFLDEEDHETVLEHDFDFCSCLKLLPIKSAIIWFGSGGNTYHSQLSDSEWSYSIFYNAQRHDYWLWFGDHQMHNLCNPFPSADEAKAGAELHYNDEPAPGFLYGSGEHKGWNRRHPRWEVADEKSVAVLAREELSETVSQICRSAERSTPSGIYWEQHRNVFAAEQVEQLVNSLHSSDRNEYLGAYHHLMGTARHCLAQWDLTQ